MNSIVCFMRYSVVALLLILLACGGGGESSAPPSPAPNIYLAQSNINFAGIVLENTAEVTFAIKNTGNTNLNIGTISITQPASAFSIYSNTCSSTFSNTLAPSQTCSLGIRFSPSTPGLYTATLSIHSNDPDSSTVNIPLNGEGYGLNVWINKVNSASCPSFVSVDVTVTDVISNIPLLSLALADFTLYQNGQLQSITASTKVDPSPVSFVLAMDWTASTANIRAELQAAAVLFINQMKVSDWAAICKFNYSVGVDFFPDATDFLDASSKNQLNTYINTPYSGDITNLYDAVMLSVNKALLGPTPKRAIIVLSDGVDNSSTATLDQAIAYANQKEIPVFTVYFVDVSYQGGNYGRPEIMQRLANETGGQYYNVITSDIASIFQQISNILSNKYILTYTPSTCSGTITVEADSGGLHGEDSTTFP